MSNSTIYKKLSALDKPFGILLIVLAGILYLYFGLFANLDLSDGKHVLFMDEQIVFNGVDLILSSENTTSFIQNITYKGDHRYGKILYNVTSLFSVIPESLYGETGQIVATRLTQVILLVISYLLLSFTFLKSWTLRGLLFICLLTLPSTSYYFMMPKPEPIQILCITFFFVYASKKKYGFGWHWFFLGLALGAKISALPILLFYFLVALFKYRGNSILKNLPTKQTLKTVLASVVGLLIAEPMLIFGKFKSYINSTWRNTEHGLDDSSIGFLDWAQLIIDECSALHLTIIILGILCALYSFSSILLKKQKINYTAHFKLEHLILFVGFLMLLLYMLRVDRLWEFYLHIPLMFITIGVFTYLEYFLINFQSRHINKIIVSSLIVPTLLAIGFVVHADNDEYTRIASRTEKPKHKQKISEYNYLTSTLKSVAEANTKPLKVFFDPQLYLIESNDNYETSKFFGYFTRWNENYDVVIYYKKHGEELSTLNVPETNVRYQNWKNAIDQYDTYTTNTNNVDSIIGYLNSTKNAPKNDVWTTNGDWKTDENMISKSTSNHIDVRVKGLGLVVGKTYNLTFEVVDYKSGKLFYKFGEGSLNNIPNIETKTYTINAVHDGKLDNFQFSGSFIGTIKNIILTEKKSKTDPKYNEDTFSKLLYIKLLDSEMPKDLEVFLRSDVFINFKNLK